MNGRSNVEIEEERERILTDIKHSFGIDNAEILPSFFKDAPHDANPIWFLGKSLEVLSLADIVVFAKGWNDARGCKIEHTVAKEYGKKVVEMTS
jgi:hypothetical protein